RQVSVTLPAQHFAEAHMHPAIGWVDAEGFLVSHTGLVPPLQLLERISKVGPGDDRAPADGKRRPEIPDGITELVHLDEGIAKHVVGVEVPEMDLLHP